MEKPSILSVFENLYRDKMSVKVLIDADCVLKLRILEDKIEIIEWLPGAEELLGVMSERPDDTQITIWNNGRYSFDQIKTLLRKGRIFAEVTQDPCYFAFYNVIMSPKAGIGYIDFPAIKEFLKKLE